MAKGKVLQTIIDIAGEISPTLGKTLDSVSDKLEGVNVKAVAAGAAVGGIAVGTIVAVGKAVGALAELGDAYNSAVNDIAAGTGLVGEELEGMSDVLKDVYGSNFGESMEDAASGITAVYQATGLTEDALANTTKAAYALSDTFGYDIAESARAAKAMMTNFGVSGEEAMGLIAAGAQNGLDYSGELIDSISEYSVQFSKLGFSADDMFNIFQQGADSGAWNLDKVGDAVKEFSIRSIDGSKTTVHAFESLGLNADEMMATFAAGGDGAAVAFQGVLTALMDMDDQVQRDALGVELFGTQWEDLGIDAMAALADVNDEAYNTEDALGKINAVKYDNLTDAFEAVKRQGEVSLLPLASTLANAFTDIAPVLGGLFEKLGPLVEQVIDKCMPFITDFLDGAMAAIEELLPLVYDIADALLPVLGSLISQLLPPVLAIIKKLLPPVLQIVEALLPTVMVLLEALLPVLLILVDSLTPILTLIGNLISSLLPPLNNLISALIPVFQFLAQVIGNTFANALAAIEPWITYVTDMFRNLIDFITNIFTGNWEGAWQNVVEIFRGLLNYIPTIAETVMNAAIAVINGIIEGINDVGGEVGITIPLIPEVKIPRFAKGGFTDGLSIAGEDPRYPNEAVISFNPAYRSQNLSYWAEAGRMLGAEASDFNLGGSSGGSNINLGGVTFAPNITVTGTASKETIMQAIEAEYPEFIDMLEEYLLGRSATVYA